MGYSHSTRTFRADGQRPAAVRSSFRARSFLRGHIVAHRVWCGNSCRTNHDLTRLLLCVEANRARLTPMLVKKCAAEEAGVDADHPGFVFNDRRPAPVYAGSSSFSFSSLMPGMLSNRSFELSASGGDHDKPITDWKGFPFASLLVFQDTRKLST